MMINKLGHSNKTKNLQWRLKLPLAKHCWCPQAFFSIQTVVNPAAPSVFHSEFGNFDQFLNSLENRSLFSQLMA